MIGVLLLMWASFQINEVHITQCSPGARAAEGVSYFAHTSPQKFRAKELRRLLNKPRPSSCDVAFPIKTHSDGDEYPTTANLVGLTIYGIIFLLFYLWYRVPVWASRRDDPALRNPLAWPDGERRDKRRKT